MNNSTALVRKNVDNIRIFPANKSRGCNLFCEHIVNPIVCIPKRVLLSFVPPIWHVKTYVFVDIIGPLLGITLLILLLQFGYCHKMMIKRDISVLNIIVEMLVYFIGISCFIFGTSHIVRAKLRFLEATTVIGYSSYGCAVTVGVPFVINSTSNDIFVISLIIFGGSCGLRVLLILVFMIPVPVARLLICSFVGTGHSLFLIYLYYSYMHATFPYDIEIRKT